MGLKPEVLALKDDAPGLLDSDALTLSDEEPGMKSGASALSVDPAILVTAAGLVIEAFSAMSLCF